MTRLLLQLAEVKPKFFENFSHLSKHLKVIHCYTYVTVVMTGHSTAFREEAQYLLLFFQFTIKNIQPHRYKNRHRVEDTCTDIHLQLLNLRQLLLHLDNSVDAIHTKNL